MKRILVIDDEEQLRHLVQLAMEKAGFEVETACDGKEGIEKFDADEFDVVVTDIQMPGMDGHQVARHIRESRRPGTKVVGLTGKPFISDFDKIYHKPYSLRDLAEEIKQIA